MRQIRISCRVGENFMLSVLAKSSFSTCIVTWLLQHQDGENAANSPDIVLHVLIVLVHATQGCVFSVSECVQEGHKVTVHELNKLDYRLNGTTWLILGLSFELR